MWFEPSKVGAYRLLCARVLWHAAFRDARTHRRPVAGRVPDLVEQRSGRKHVGRPAPGLFQSQGCVACHADKDTERGPALGGLYGKQVRLQDGKVIVADENYIRESIVNPAREDCCRLSPDHADVQGHRERRRNFADHFVSQISRPSGRSAGGKMNDVAARTPAALFERELRRKILAIHPPITSALPGFTCCRLRFSFLSAVWPPPAGAWNCSRRKGNLVQAETYNKLFTMHGVDDDLLFF